MTNGRALQQDMTQPIYYDKNTMIEDYLWVLWRYEILFKEDHTKLYKFQGFAENY